jgi:putative DNA primase/helicase
MDARAYPPGYEPIKPTAGLPPPSDDALALLFADRYAGRLCYVAKWSQWLSWTGTHWRPDDTLAVWDFVRDELREAASQCKPRIAKEVTSAKTVAAVERLARTDRRLAATTEQWDADRWLLNTPDGAVDLKTGKLRRHRAEDYLRKITAVGPSGDCPRFKAFLAKIMNDDEALVAYLQRVFGYCLTGDVSEQAIFFNYGVGQNGKTVLMSTVAGMLGDYCLATPIETFTESRNDRHPTELARMLGARLVTATETEAGRYWAESRLKELTGGERIPARFMHKDFFEYLPQFKPFISGNHKPRLRSVGVAMRRRVNMIPFAVTIPDSERDPGLADKLKDEWPGVLEWAIEGCLEWRERGLAPPEAVTKATDAYFAGEDGYADWIADRCEVIPGSVSRSSDLFASWRDWAEKAGQRAGDTKRFREEMERLGFPPKHTRDGNYYLGLRIRQDHPKDDWGQV